MEVVDYGGSGGQPVVQGVVLVEAKALGGVGHRQAAEEQSWRSRSQGFGASGEGGRPGRGMTATVGEGC